MVNAATFSAVVVMVIVTTLVTPPALKWSLGPSGEACYLPVPKERLG